MIVILDYIIVIFHFFSPAPKKLKSLILKEINFTLMTMECIIIIMNTLILFVHVKLLGSGTLAIVNMQNDQF